jgi:3-deoxy-D-manno-octulosonate 8-phosphate phosphatase (KDO 8-P phosphatase)
MAPVLNFDPALLLLAQGVKVAFFDVDGVLTDGGLLFSESGETLKRFNTLDGHGLKLLQLVGITPVVITGRDSKALRARLLGWGLNVHFLARRTSALLLKRRWPLWVSIGVRLQPWGMTGQTYP